MMALMVQDKHLQQRQRQGREVVRETPLHEGNHVEVNIEINGNNSNSREIGGKGVGIEERTGITIEKKDPATEVVEMIEMREMTGIDKEIEVHLVVAVVVEVEIGDGMILTIHGEDQAQLKLEVPLQQHHLERAVVVVVMPRHRSNFNSCLRKEVAGIIKINSTVHNRIMVNNLSNLLPRMVRQMSINSSRGIHRRSNRRPVKDVASLLLMGRNTLPSVIISVNYVFSNVIL
jgi:hypothetical protein